MSTERKFASQADLQEKQVSFDKLSDNAYAYTAEGDPNTGIVIGDDAVLVADAQATSIPSTCCPRVGTGARRSSTCSSTTPRAICTSTQLPSRISICAGRTRSSRSNSNPITSS